MAVSLLNLDASDLSVEVHTLVHIQTSRFKKGSDFGGYMCSCV